MFQPMSRWGEAEEMGALPYMVRADTAQQVCTDSLAHTRLLSLDY